MPTQDIRWIQRFNNFNKAFAQLTQAVELSNQRALSKLEEQGLVQAFEYTHELAWNTLKDFLEERGVKNLYGSKDATRQAFQAGLIENGDAWMQMIASRNLTTRTYDETTVAKIVAAVIEEYYAEFRAFQIKRASLKKDQV